MRKKLINEMLINKIHLGHKKNLINKEMKKYIININKEIHIINLEITLKKFKKIIKILKEIKKKNQTLLTVCTEKKTKKIVKYFNEKINMPYVNKRWLGGSITNFKTLKSSVSNMNYIRKTLESKKFKIKKKKKYIYKRKFKKLKNFLWGLRKIKKIPEYVFIINVKKNKNVIKEAKKRGVYTIAVVDTNNSIKNIDYIIPGNDDSYKSLLFYIKKITFSIKNG